MSASVPPPAVQPATGLEAGGRPGGRRARRRGLAVAGRLGGAALLLVGGAWLVAWLADDGPADPSAQAPLRVELPVVAPASPDEQLMPPDGAVAGGVYLPGGPLLARLDQVRASVARAESRLVEASAALAEVSVRTDTDPRVLREDAVAALIDAWVFVDGAGRDVREVSARASADRVRAGAERLDGDWIFELARLRAIVRHTGERLDALVGKAREMGLTVPLP